MEFDTRFWMGYTLIDGKPVMTLPYGVKVPRAAIQGLVEHNVREYTNLRNLPTSTGNWEVASPSRSARLAKVQLGYAPAQMKSECARRCR